MPDDANPPAIGASGGEPVRVAVSLHEAAAGGDHLDLFVGPARSGSPDDRTARCWRLPCSAWTPEGFARGRFAALEIAPHRAEYLELTEPRTLSDGRGRVIPLSSGAGWMAGGKVEALGRVLAFRSDGTVDIARAPSQEGR